MCNDFTSNWHFSAQNTATNMAFAKCVCAFRLASQNVIAENGMRLHTMRQCMRANDVFVAASHFASVWACVCTMSLQLAERRNGEHLPRMMRFNPIRNFISSEFLEERARRPLTHTCKTNDKIILVRISTIKFSKKTCCRHCNACISARKTNYLCANDGRLGCEREYRNDCCQPSVARTAQHTVNDENVIDCKAVCVDCSLL